MLFQLLARDFIDYLLQLFAHSFLVRPSALPNRTRGLCESQNPKSDFRQKHPVLPSTDVNRAHWWTTALGVLE